MTTTPPTPPPPQKPPTPPARPPGWRHVAITEVLPDWVLAGEHHEQDYAARWAEQAGLDPPPSRAELAAERARRRALARRWADPEQRARLLATIPDDYLTASPDPREGERRAWWFHRHGMRPTPVDLHLERQRRAEAEPQDVTP